MGEKHLKRRGLASLLIVSIVAIAAVFGVVFAFQHAGRETDVYGSVTVTVDKPKVDLEIELEKDPNADKKFRIVKTESSSAYVTITVGGLPETSDRGVELHNSSVSNGIVSVTPVTPAEEVQKTGVNTFYIEGKNGGAPTTLLFTTRSGAQTVSVNVSVKMIAKDMKISPTSHFGIRQGGDELNLMSTDILNKFLFFAHSEDTEGDYTPNYFPVTYRLKDEAAYPGVILRNGVLSVTNEALCIDQYIYVQAKLPDMTEWIDVPFYVFPAVNDVIIKTNAFKAEDTGANVWDLIANRSEYSSADFEFALDCDKTPFSDYAFTIRSTDTQIVRIDTVDQYTASLSTVQNLGEVALEITSYPILKIGGKEVAFNDATDENVKIHKTIYLRVRNEFHTKEESAAFGSESFHLAPSKDTVNAFFYEGNYYETAYIDVFDLDTYSGKIVNFEDKVEFELIVDDQRGERSGVYGWDAAKNPGNIGLYSILQIGYWSDVADDWVMLSGKPGDGNYYAHYKNRFCLSFIQSDYAEDFLSDDMTLTLSVKSLKKLTNGEYATCDINLDVTSAIDKFEVDGLTRFDDGVVGVALVHDTKQQSFSQHEVKVYGKVARTSLNGQVKYINSEKWNTAKISDNRKDLPFTIESVEQSVNGIYYMAYRITAKDIEKIEYYTDYPVIIEYANGVSYNFNVRVYPTVEKLSMSVVSDSHGIVHETITDDYDSDYEYVRTVYVRKGYTYKFAVNTQGVAVGAYAIFDNVCDANGKVINGTSSNVLDARNLAEGLYECSVSLHAYSNEVYGDNQRDNILVYVIVIDLVGNVVLPTNVILEGITDSAEIALEMTSLDGKVIDDFTFVKIEVAEPLNPNVTVEQGSDYNKFNITAKYLAEDAFSIGFKVYKKYEFPSDKFDLDGNALTKNEPVVFNYIGGTLVTSHVSIKNLNPNKLSVSNGVKYSTNIGNYVELISSDEIKEIEIEVKTSETAKYEQYGIAVAEWRNGKFEIDPFSVIGNSTLDIAGCATARIGAATGKIYVQPVQNQTSLGVYALVVYAADSLRYVGTDNQQDLVMPGTYQLVTLFVGSEEDIKDKTNALNSNIVFDANSGKRNTRGGYNWILPSQNPNDLKAVLFFTNGEDTYGSQIVANTYFLDDLYTVLGWEFLKKPADCYLYKKVNGVTVGNSIELDNNNGRLNINLNHKFTQDDNNFYSKEGTVVSYELHCNARTMIFYAVEGIDVFEIMISSNTGSGLVARKNLAPDEYTNEIDMVTMQRGNEFSFFSNLKNNTGWQLKNHNFDSEEAARTDSITYDGGTYTFNPYVVFDEYVFDLNALTANVKVEIKGGVNYLNLSQESITLDGVTTATYDLTMRIDQEVWSPNLLTYKFFYNNHYYNLFEDNQTISYINMEGNKAKLEFKLTCLNDKNPVYANLYYTYYLRIDVAVVVTVVDVDPFYNVAGARLYVTENLSDSPLLNIKNPLTDSAALNLVKDGIDNVTMAHFADTKPVENNKTALTLVDGQTDSSVIYLDEDATGGILVIYPTPYYINVVNINLWTAQPHTEKVLIGNDLTGKPIYDTITYTIGFTQMIYNEDLKIYQPYVSNNTMPRMISSWSKVEGYKWDGKYYFKTSIVSNSYVAHRLPNGTKFGISVSIQGETNAKAITESMTITAKYRDSFVITPDDDVEDFAVSTMKQTQYQALGTTAVYDIAFPKDCVPNYAGITFNGVAAISKVIENEYARVEIDSVAQTLTVRLKDNLASIGAELEIRVPYQRPGDYIKPYLSVLIVPVYFELNDLEVIGHYETCLQVTREELYKLKYQASFDYDTSVITASISARMATFNESLKTSKLLSYTYEEENNDPNQLTVEFSYSYVDGVPVITKNGVCRYVKTFTYDVLVEPAVEAVAKHTEYLAVGTSATYTFENWDPLNITNIYLDNTSKNKYKGEHWDAFIRAQDRNTVVITVSLENTSKTISNNDAYKALINERKLVFNIFTPSNKVQSQLELTIIPVYFTFEEFKLKNNPVNPIVALTTPTVVTVEAGKISAAEDSDVTNAINTFNNELLDAQNNLANVTTLKFNRVENDDGILNFNFDTNSRALTRADSSNPITATSYLLVSAGISYVNGIPTLNNNGEKFSTYLPVCTYGNEIGDSGNAGPNFETAPNGRTRTIAQAIGTSVKYNIALPGVIYDRTLDKYEVRVDGNYAWDETCAWSVMPDLKRGAISVSLNADTSLFNKVLSILAYSREGKLMYVLNIVPTYFTVEQILLADHLDENPVMIKTGDAGWLNKLKLDFKTNHVAKLNGFDFDAEINKFLTTLNNSSLVSRIDDAGYITVFAGVNYVDGIPSLANLVNAKIPVQNSYRYVMIDGTPENTKAHSLGQEIIYNVNRTVGLIKVSLGKDENGNENWKNYNKADYTNWYVQPHVNDKQIVLGLDEDPNLIGNLIRIGIFVNITDEEPSYILNILPAYFSVEDLTYAGQTVEDRDIFLYYGDEIDSPAEVIFDAVYKYTNSVALNVPPMIDAFKADLQKSKAQLIVRDYDDEAVAGDLRVTLYLDYKNGKPTLVDATNAGDEFVVRLDYDFTYAIYGKPLDPNNFPPLPSGPRTRAEVQAIGTSAQYVIDLDEEISIDVDYLTYDENKLKQRGWKIDFEDKVLTVDLLAEHAKTLLANDDIEIKCYVGYELVYVLTIKPVLFEVIGIETIFPEQPVYLEGKTPTAIDYRVVAKYSDQVTLDDDQKVVNYLDIFNAKLKEAKGGLFKIEVVDNQYLKLAAAIDYGKAGSPLRTVPGLLNVDNYPLNTIESYIEFSTTVESSSAKHHQAIGTVEYYNLGLAFKNAAAPSVMVNGETILDDSVIAEVVEYGNSYALKVEFKPDTTLLNQDITIKVDDFTMEIKPVWFLVEGFDVIEHPERHMWLIVGEQYADNVDNLLFRVRARHSTYANPAFQNSIKEQIAAFNAQLATYDEINKTWVAGAWASNLETYTIGNQYLVVRAGIEYNEQGVANILMIDEAQPNQIVRDIFAYAYYSDKVENAGFVRPNIPRSRTVELAIGRSAVYTIDFPELELGFTDDMYALYQNSNPDYADDDSKLIHYVNGTDGWTVKAQGNQLYVELEPNADLVTRELKVFIYYERGHIKDAPNSYDVENVAFILTIRPVWFKVVDIAINGYPTDEIKVESLSSFMGELSSLSSGVYFVPVLEYSDDASIQAALKEKMTEFINEFRASSHVTRTRTRENEQVYHFQVTTSVNYSPFNGTAVLCDETASRIWKTFKVEIVNTVDNEAVVERVEAQAIDTTKTYYIESGVLEDVDTISDGEHYEIIWDKVNNPNYVSVKLKDTASVNNPVTISINPKFNLIINPVYYEVLGFETVDHPERAVWVITPYTVKDLRYRAITTELSESFADDVLAQVQESITNFNLSLNTGSAPVSIATDSGQNIIFDAAIDYDNGYPAIVEITKDKRNVVESIIPYRIWSANIRPKPEQPTVVGTTQVNQIIGGTKLYTMKNIRGQVYYQYLWVENGGSLVSPFDKSANGTTQVYENLSILVDPVKGTLKIQLVVKDNYLNDTVRIYLPYLTTVNGKDVWYSHCLEITPLLFELTGWTIEAQDANVGQSQLIKDEDPDYLILTTTSNEITLIKYVAKIRTNVKGNEDLENAVNIAKQNLENLAVNYIDVTVSSPYISFDYLALHRNVNADEKTTNIVGLSTFIIYENGVPKLVDRSKSLISNEISISTGYDNIGEAPKPSLSGSSLADVQAVGTVKTHVVNIPDAVKVFTQEIEVVNRLTKKPVEIPGEQSNLVEINCDDLGSGAVNIEVTLAPVIALRNLVIEVKIPYAKDENAEKPSHYYSLYITPAVFVVEGFYLENFEDNNVQITSQDLPFVLRVQATYSSDISVRNMVNFMLKDFENSINKAIQNGILKFKINNLEGGINVSLLTHSNMIWIHQDGDLTAINEIVCDDASNGDVIIVKYENGVPQLRTDNNYAATDSVIDFSILINSQKGVVGNFPGWDNVREEKSSSFLQSIGTTREYLLNMEDDPNVSFYYQYIDVVNGGLKKGEKEYEYLAYSVINPGFQNLKLNFTLPASAKHINANDYIDVRIPYVRNDNEGVHWYYYSLKIKPVLFEIKGWKLKVGDELVDSITLNDSMIELIFSPDIKSGTLDLTYYTQNELKYIKNAIKNLETELNTYDPTISDGYTYMVINNSPEEGHQVNFTIWRDESINTSYLMRDANDSSTTIMQLSANISYGVSNFNQEYVDGAQAVKPYSTVEDAQRITSLISIFTTDKTMTEDSDRSTVFITDENASILKSLNSGVDYVLMSDICLNEIQGLDNGRWKPVSFPADTTLDGNNHKVYFNGTGFDLSDKPGNVGMFTEIPSGSVVKNLQIVLEQGNSVNESMRLEVSLEEYNGSANVGLLAGVNNGIVTNCAILSEWQFNMRELLTIRNPMTGQNFDRILPFNADQEKNIIFDDKYFYEINNEGSEVVRVYNNQGYGFKMTEEGEVVYENGEPVIEYDEWHNVIHWINPDRTSVAKYDNYSPIMDRFKQADEKEIDGKSAAKLYVYANNKELSVTLGGLVGINGHMITNSRVLIDVELYGPEQSTGAGEIDDINVLKSTVGGLVGINNGTITTSYYRDGSVTNNANAVNSNDTNVSLLGGFAGQNNGLIQQSYAMGRSTGRETKINHISGAGAVKTIRNSLGAFAHINNGTITDCLVNMVVYKTGTEGEAGGFVYQNTAKGIINNCVENNNIILQSGATLDYYKPFVVINGPKKTDNVVTTNLSNLIYAGNAKISFSDDWNGTIKRLTNQDSHSLYDLNNYQSFSMANEDGSDGMTANNTIWKMTKLGPVLRAANEVTISFRKYAWSTSPYLYNPGTAENPYLVWNEEQFNRYIYGATANATAADKIGGEGTLTDIEDNRQTNHIRLIDNVTLNGIKDTYKIIYMGTIEGNGLTMSGISLDTVANDLATIGLFGKTEYATIRNINFEIGNINSTARYVGGIAGIAINTSFVDVKVKAQQSTNVIKGANIVGGFVGLNIVNDPKVENYNIYSSVSATANFHDKQTDEGATFTSGIEYYRQTLYSRVEAFDITYEQGYGTAGSVFGFITSNPNNYRKVENGVEIILPRNYEQLIELKDASGWLYDSKLCESQNTEKEWFAKNRSGKYDDTDVYYTDQIVLRKVSGDVKDISANVAGGLIGIMDETIELHKPDLKSLNSLTGKYYLGGLVGINLGKISGEIIKTTQNEIETLTTYSTANLGSKWSISSSAGESYIFRDMPESETANKFWGMSVGGIAGYNDGLELNTNSGVIKDINVNINVLAASSSSLQYAIGGVVGSAGDYSLVDNAINTNSAVNLDKVQVNTAQQAAKIGYYYGQIVGRSSITNSSLAGGNTTRMSMLRIDIPNYGVNSYVSAENFGTPNNMALAFQVKINSETKKSETLKQQTMTLEEYKKYLAANITSRDLATRVEMLEPWVRSLPTMITRNTLNKELVYVETFNEKAKEEFLNWVIEHEVFEKWSGRSVLEGKVFDDYKSYLYYSAVSTKSTTEENEGAFIDKIEEYRKLRYDMAKEFFTYQYQVIKRTGKTYTERNAEFTWLQYEEYLNLKNLVIAKKDLDKISYEEIDNKYAFAEMLYPNNVFAEFDGENSTYINDLSDFRKMLDIFASNKEEYRFTNKDPLQTYINFVVNRDQAEIGDWQMTLAQQFNYMMNIYGKEYLYDKYKYSVPGDLPEFGTNGYSTYLYLNSVMSSASSDMLTIGEYIDMMKRESEIVIENETNWVKTGHLANGARISDIGAVTLDWVSHAKDWDASKLEEENGVISDGVNKWDALAIYGLTKATMGMQINLYKDMVKLGGSLYHLYTNYPEDNQSTAAYVFALRSEQYNWTQAQSTFVMNHYENKNNNYDLQYALAATTDSNIIGVSGSIRAVYKNSVQIVTGSGDWFIDNDGNGEYTAGEPIGVWYFPTVAGTTIFKNGDGQEYFFTNPGSPLELSGDGEERGAAMYIDRGVNGSVGDKMFGSAVSLGGDASARSAGNDVLILSQVAEELKSDFYQKDEKGNKTYYKIVRQIVKGQTVTNITKNGTDVTGNTADYLEEALWWRAQGFTALEFDQIKAHAMIGHHVPSSGRVNQDDYTQRNSGFTLADDWTSTITSGQSGFKQENFKQYEYTKIVLAAKYVNNIWYSTYADYYLFKVLYHADDANVYKIIKKIPETSKFNNPFVDTFTGKDSTKEFVEGITDETELSDAIEILTDREAFMKMFNAGYTTPEYKAWAEKYYFKLKGEDRYFRLNHYIYCMEKEVTFTDAHTKLGDFTVQDFRWVLTQDIRIDIFYDGVTQEAVTTDLIEYRRNWYSENKNLNNGIPFITYRDYCEWINIYKYNDQYQTDRGEFENPETGEIETTGDGWLTIEAFATWKRMEKYENNVNFINSLGEAEARQAAITAPILKRQISTTVFPKIQSSGNKDSQGVYRMPYQPFMTGEYKNRTLYSSTKESPDKKDPKDYDWAMEITKEDEQMYKAIDYYQWGAPDESNTYYYDGGWWKTNEDGEQEEFINHFSEYYITMFNEAKYDVEYDMNYPRHVYDRYEYNERYKTYKVNRHLDAIQLYGKDPIDMANLLINDVKFAKECNEECGGYTSPNNCTNHTHAAWQFRQWERYGYSTTDWTVASMFIVSLPAFTFCLDETSIYYGYKFKAGEQETMTPTRVPVSYAQLYIPYDYFKSACKAIKDQYSASNDYAGYHNYMKYWARNGEYYWICDFSEYKGTLNDEVMKDIVKVNKTYLVKSFWDNYNGTLSPINGLSYQSKHGRPRAYGFEE